MSKTLMSEQGVQCFHCGLPVPENVELSVEIDGIRKPMCCAGCEAVATAIVAGGSASYYTRRDAFGEPQRDRVPDVLAQLKLFDRADVQKRFVDTLSEHEREATLIFEGMTCPACIWLNETHLARVPGVATVNVNYTTGRAKVRWDERKIVLSDILKAVRDIGYKAYPYDAHSLEATRRREARDLLLRFAIAGLGMIQVMMYAIPRYLATDGSLDAGLESLMNWSALVLTLPVVLYSAAPFIGGALRDLRVRRVGMDVPVALAVLIAFSSSVIATVSGRGEIYFDSVAMFVFFLLGARYLELRARHKAAAYLETLSLAMPEMARRLVAYPQSLDTELIPADSLEPEDLVQIRPGETFPADGILISGSAEVDEALLTGESMPIVKNRGDRITGGTVNRGDAIVVRVEVVGEKTMLSAIVRLMERASHERPRLQQITDRVASRFVSVVLLLAVATAVWWWQVDPESMLSIVVSVLIVTCPCALALATPMALAVATGVSARQGLLITRAHALETLARTTHIVLDKTGTVTIGRPTLKETIALRVDPQQAIRLAACLEQASEHPFALAFRESMRMEMVARDLRYVAGEGIEGTIDERKFRIGSRRFAAALCGRDTGGEIQAQVWLADEDGMLAGFKFHDPLKDDAVTMVRTLHALGYEVSLLSGDHEAVVQRTAHTLGVRSWHGEVSPQGKKAFVEKLQLQGAVVAMVGDGINDAPVIAQAQVAIALISGAALTQGAADMVLLSGHLNDLTRLMRYARRTLSIVRQNLGWAIGYNLLAVPLAMTGNISPWMAAIGMSASSLLVVGNALRLTRFNGPVTV